MKNRKLYIYFVLFLVISVVAVSCYDDFTFDEINCSECYRVRPENGEIIINVTINNENPGVPVKIYRDKIETGRLRIKDTVKTNRVYFEVPLNHYYSVIAKYSVGNDSVFAVDGERIETKKITDQCDTICWIIKGGKYDLRLKENTNRNN